MKKTYKMVSLFSVATSLPFASNFSLRSFSLSLTHLFACSPKGSSHQKRRNKSPSFWEACPFVCKGLGQKKEERGNPRDSFFFCLQQEPKRKRDNSSFCFLTKERAEEGHSFVNRFAKEKKRAKNTSFSDVSLGTTFAT
jgi:hypothetical protein